jgi:hypothetical protein
MKFRPGVALHEDRLTVEVGHPVQQMVELDAGEEVDGLPGILRLERRLDLLELVVLVLANRPHRPEAREIEGAGTGAVPGCDVAHEVLRDRERHVGVTGRLEPGLARSAVDEEEVLGLVDSPDVRDRDAERLERAIDLGLAVEAHEGPHAATPTALEEQRASKPSGVSTSTRKPCRPPAVSDPPTRPCRRSLFQPAHDCRIEISHSPSPCIAARRSITTPVEVVDTGDAADVETHIDTFGDAVFRDPTVPPPPRCASETRGEPRQRCGPLANAMWRLAGRSMSGRRVGNSPGSRSASSDRMTRSPAFIGSPQLDVRRDDAVRRHDRVAGVSSTKFGMRSGSFVTISRCSGWRARWWNMKPSWPATVSRPAAYNSVEIWRIVVVERSPRPPRRASS